MEKIRFGFVGAGFMAQVAHIPNFISIEGVEPVALAETRPNLASAIACRFGIPKTYPTHLELAKDSSIDAVVSITGFDANPEIAEDLLLSGKHVFIEKPMALSSEAASAMIRAAEKSGRILMVGYMKRYDTGVELAKRKIKDWISTGEVGDITYARATCFGGDWICGPVDTYFTDEPVTQVLSRRLPVYPSWLGREMYQEFWSFSNLYTHNINLLRFLLDRELTVQSVKINARTKVVTFDAEGVPVVLEGGGMRCHEWHEETVVYFDRGYVRVKTPSPLMRNVPATVEVYTWSEECPETSRPVPPWDWSFRREAQAFVQCIRKGELPVSSGEDSTKDVCIIEDVFRKANVG